MKTGLTDGTTAVKGTSKGSNRPSLNSSKSNRVMLQMFITCARLPSQPEYIICPKPRNIKNLLTYLTKTNEFLFTKNYHLFECCHLIYGFNHVFVSIYLYISRERHEIKYINSSTITLSHPICHGDFAPYCLMYTRPTLQAPGTGQCFCHSYSVLGSM